MLTADALAARLALALRATAANFERCAPSTPDVLEHLARYLDDPTAAQDALDARTTRNKNMRIAR